MSSMLMRALFACAVPIALVACGSEERPRGSTAPLFDAGERSEIGARDSASASDTAVSDSATAETSSDTSIDATTSDVDSPPDVTVVAKCSGNYAAYASGALVAGGVTPSAFAKAYNAEVASMTYPGPLLLAFKGIDDSAPWKLRVGALEQDGAGVRFFGKSAEVDYTKTPGVTLLVPEQSASFKLRFATATTSVQLPVDAVRVTATAGDCSELSVDELLLMIPESARNEPFAGSTVGALMGAPITTDGGPSFYLLELLGSEKKISVTGGVP